MKLFNLGTSELIMIFLFAILAVGPKEAARLARQVGDYTKSIRGVFSELSSEITRSAAEVLETPAEEGKS